MKTLRKFIKEASQSKTAVLTYGRMNPPTIGHVKLAEVLKAEASKRKADSFIFLSPSQNPKKDPLSPDRKKFYAQRTLGKGITIEVKPNIFKGLSDLYDQGYKNVVIVVGSDRIGEFSKIVPQYNGVEGKAHGFYDFELIGFQSSGDRDPDAEGVEGMSASKLRGFAVSSDFDNFKKGTNLSDKDAKSLYNEIRKAMKVESLIHDSNANILSEISEAKKGPDDPKVPGHQPKKYGAGLSKETAAKRYATWEKTKKMSDSDQRAYDMAAVGDDKPASKESKYTKRYREKFGEEVISEAEIEGLKKKAEKSGVSYGILKQVYNRGMAAWKTGHRPGTTPQQWAFARVNSFLTGGKTRTTADADLWAKTKKKSEEVDFNDAFSEWKFMSEADAYVDTPIGSVVVPKTSPKNAEVNIKRKFMKTSDREKVAARTATAFEKRYGQKIDLDDSGETQK